MSRANISKWKVYVATTGIAFAASVHLALNKIDLEKESLYEMVENVTNDQFCLFVNYNLALILILWFGQFLIDVFVGKLRANEFEQIIDNSRGFLADTVLFLIFYQPTMNRTDVRPVYIINYMSCVIFWKFFHLAANIKIDRITDNHVQSESKNLRLYFFVFILNVVDASAIFYFAPMSNKNSTFYIWLLFEFVSMLLMAMVYQVKFVLQMRDLSLPSWPQKQASLFVIELFADVLSVLIFIVFMVVFFVANPSRLPVYVIVDLFHTCRSVYNRLLAIQKYKTIMRKIDEALLTVTEEECLNAGPCIICREELRSDNSRKLSCGHVFHLECLKSWLVIKSSCPTCRMDILAELEGETNAKPDDLPVNNNSNVALTTGERVIGRSPSVARELPPVLSSRSHFTTKVQKHVDSVPVELKFFSYSVGFGEQMMAGREAAVFMADQASQWRAARD